MTEYKALKNLGRCPRCRKATSAEYVYCELCREYNKKAVIKFKLKAKANAN